MKGSLVQDRRRPVIDGKPYWKLRVYAGRDPVTGKDRVVEKGMRATKRAAEAALRKLAAEVDEGTHAGTDGTLAQLLERWMAQYTPDWSPTTAARYEQLCRVHILPALGSMPLAKLRQTHLNDLYAAITAKGLEQSTVRKVHNLLRRALSVAVEWGWLNTNVALRAKRPKPKKAPITPPSDDQVAAVVAQALKGQRPNRDLVVLLTLAAATGARRGELCGLRFSDFDQERRELFVGRSVAQVGAQLTVKGTKGERQRRISLDEATAGVLADYLERKRSAMVRAVADPFMFATELDGSKPWPPARITRNWTNLRARAGVPGVRLHDLRHAHVTLLLALGVDVRTVAGRVGHANAATTLGIYGHFMPAADRAAAELWAGRRRDEAPAPSPEAEDGG
jgi:integrase